MDFAEIEQLARVHGDPAVSILCSLDRKRPGNLEDPRRLETFRKRAIALLSDSIGAKRAQPVVERIDEAMASVDLEHPSDAVAILVTADQSHVLTLPFPVPERVVLDETFATRDLVDAAHRSLRARVIVVAAEDVRCFDATGSSLREIRDNGFPLHLSPPVQEDTPRRDLPIGEHERAEARRVVLRAADDALRALQNRERLPLIVVGTVRELSYFDEVTRNGADVIGRVHGNHIADGADELARVIEPVLGEEHARRAEEAVRRADEALGTGAAVGFEAVASAAAAGRGRELIVEAHLHVDPKGETGSDDPLDEVIESVLAHGGTVTTVPDGALADHAGIALILRY